MSYNLLKPVTIYDGASLDANATSSVVEIKNQDNIGIQLTWTEVPVGTFAVQVSSDHLEDMEGNVINAGNWVSLTLSPAISAVGAPDTAYIDLNQLSAMYIRVVYTRSSGEGTVTGIVVGKGI